MTDKRLAGVLVAVVLATLSACVSTKTLDEAERETLESIALAAANSALNTSSNPPIYSRLTSARFEFELELKLQRPSSETFYTRDDVKRIVTSVAKAYLEQARELISRSFIIKLDLQAHAPGTHSERIVTDRQTSTYQRYLGTTELTIYTYYRDVESPNVLRAFVVFDKWKLLKLPLEGLTFETLQSAMNSCRICNSGEQQCLVGC